ncbi:hypothetical protein [Frankia tisae]|uniref:hypothetical protein n=1 Tax=Frankia tisae TaxID=2950104 RepID=UPI0021BE8028|nr:hypothetical protein [Frankia tisae]
MSEYQHLGTYSDLVRVAREQQGGPIPPAFPGARTRALVRDTLGFGGDWETPGDVRVEQRWKSDGLLGEEISWSVGFGPRTHAYVLKPANVDGPLPGVLALHSHDGMTFYGKEKVADGPSDVPPAVAALRARQYGSRAFADALAREGFVVLAHDTFLWGSRRFPTETLAPQTRRHADNCWQLSPSREVSDEVAWHDAASWHHEHIVEKYCALLGTTLAGVVAFEDRVAAAYLTSRPDVAPAGIGCIGLSGGGCRAALLQATCEQVAAAVIVGMMSTYDGLLDRHVAGHGWLFFPAAWPRHGDWPDLAACRAPSPLLVQYNRHDQLFSPAAG